jgi:NitT/TauT family transport system ATP-binding protein
MRDPILVVRNLSMTYANGTGAIQALKDVSFTVSPKEFVCVVGPSGCGKTTLLRILGGLRTATSGEVLLDGEVLRGPRLGNGFVFQQANLMPWRTVLHNVMLPLELEEVPLDERLKRSKAMLALVGLAGFEDTLPRDLSGGMAQRVAIARALVHEPDVLLLDEPFGALDALTRERMGSELLRIWDARTVTVVMVTHSISEAIFLGDRVLVLSKRPGTVRLELPIPFSRPRQMSMTHTQEFGNLAEQARNAIEVE